jgi:hypothetical protein
MQPVKPRPHAPPPDAPEPSEGAGAIPDAQLRALERRHALDAQQRTFDGGGIPAPHLWSRRPPG